MPYRKRSGARAVISNHENRYKHYYIDVKTSNYSQLNSEQDNATGPRSVTVRACRM